MSRCVGIQASVSVHADQVVTVLTLSKSSQCHMTKKGSFEFDFTFFQGLSLSLSLSCVFNGFAPCCGQTIMTFSMLYPNVL